MPDSQYYALVAIPLLSILLQSGLFMYLASRINKLARSVAQLVTRVALLEERGK